MRTTLLEMQPNETVCFVCFGCFLSINQKKGQGMKKKGKTTIAKIWKFMVACSKHSTEEDATSGCHLPLWAFFKKNILTNLFVLLTLVEKIF